MTETAPSLHVLIMDDEPAIIDVIQAALEDEGRRVTTSGVPLSVDEIEALAPDVLLLDLFFAGEPVTLPLIERVRACPALMRLPIILCTAATRALEPMVEQFAALDVQLLAKPFDLDDLLAMIDRVADAVRIDAVA